MGVTSTCHIYTELLELVKVCWMCKCYDWLSEGRVLSVNCIKKSSCQNDFAYMGVVSTSHAAYVSLLL